MIKKVYKRKCPPGADICKEKFCVMELLHTIE